MNEYSTFLTGVADATADLRAGIRPSVGPTDSGSVTLNYIISEFRSRLNCSDSYLAGYLSVIYDPQNGGVI